MNDDLSAVIERSLRRHCVARGHIEADPLVVTVEDTARRERNRTLQQIFDQWPDDPEVDASVVYFVAGGDLVKIGTTVAVERRLSDLRTQSPVPLELLHTVPGGFVTERYLHRVFVASRDHFEWFAPSPLLLALLLRLIQRDRAWERLRAP